MLKTVLTIVYMISALLLVVAVSLQPTKSEGLGMLGGGGNVFNNRKTRGFEGVLERATTWISALFLVLTIAFLIVK